jgi:hypothetical protein
MATFVRRPQPLPHVAPLRPRLRQPLNPLGERPRLGRRLPPLPPGRETGLRARQPGLRAPLPACLVRECPNVTARAIMDDISLAGPPAEVFRALSIFRAWPLSVPCRSTSSRHTSLSHPPRLASPSPMATIRTSEWWSGSTTTALPPGCSASFPSSRPSTGLFATPIFPVHSPSKSPKLTAIPLRSTTRVPFPCVCPRPPSPLSTALSSMRLAAVSSSRLPFHLRRPYL